MNGKVQKYDDLPEQYQKNIDPQAPLDSRAKGTTPAMTEQEMNDLEAFINMLTDDYQPPAPVLTAVPKEDPNAQLRLALDQNLSKDGYVCLGKFDWPVVVSADDFVHGTRDAVQMPVLEQLGVVAGSTETPSLRSGEMAVTRYTLTDAGRQYYLSRPTPAAAGSAPSQRSDLCPVHLSLDSVVSSQVNADSRQAMLTYTYKAAAADWMRTPEARRVFPMLDRLLGGESRLKMQQRFVRTNEVWTAVSPHG